jgi:hypothetical protein
MSTGALFDEKGVVQRVVLALFMAWSAAFAIVGLSRNRTVSR